MYTSIRKRLAFIKQCQVAIEIQRGKTSPCKRKIKQHIWKIRNRKVGLGVQFNWRYGTIEIKIWKLEKNDQLS